jgi:transcription-repair coupling factor (superfamily II helicase)
MADAARKTDGTGYAVLSGMPEGQDARVIAERARDAMGDDRVLVHVALDDARVATLKDLLEFFAPDVRVCVFPAWDCLPYDRVSPHNDIVAQRVAALSMMLAWENESRREPRVVLTTINAAAQRVSPRDAMRKAVLEAKRGGRLDIKQLQVFLQHNGYTRTDTVREAGEFAIRGGIVDLYPPGYDEPLRIDLFGDEVESIRSFDPVSQRTDKKLSHFTLHPATEFFLDDESVARFRAGYREKFGVVRDNDPLYEAVSVGRRYNGMDHWLPLFFDSMDTLFDYTRNAVVTMDAQAPQAAEERHRQVEDFFGARKTLEQAAGKKKKDGADVSLSGTVYRPLPPGTLYLSEKEWAERTAGAVVFSPFAPPEGGPDGGGRRGRDFGDVRAQPNGDVFAALAEYVSAQRMDGKRILIAAYSPGSRERLRSLMSHAGFANFVEIEGADDLKKLTPYMCGMAVLALESGFAAPDIVVLTEQDILGDRMARRAKKKRKADNFLTEVSGLSPGDLVVHLDHGVGRFIGLETLKAGKLLHDCLKIEYAGGDRL